MQLIAVKDRASKVAIEQELNKININIKPHILTIAGHDNMLPQTDKDYRN